MSRRGPARSGAASGWNKVGTDGGASSSACAALWSAASASVFDLRGARRPGGAVVAEEEDTADVGGGRAVAGERGVGLAEPDGCGIGMAPWTDISRDDMTVVGGLGATGEPMGLARGVAASASAVRARRGVPRVDCAGDVRRMTINARKDPQG